MPTAFIGGCNNSEEVAHFYPFWKVQEMQRKEVEEAQSDKAVEVKQLSKRVSAAKRRREAIASVAVRCQPSVQKMQRIREAAGVLLQETIRTHAAALLEHPMRELLLYDNIESLKKTLQPNIRACLHSNLTHPENFLHLSSVQQRLPDLCMLFKESEQKGRLLNLYEWFESFKTHINPLEPEAKLLDLQARFVKGVTELEMLGYVKKNARRRGHVEALSHV